MDKISLTKVLKEIDEEVFLNCGAISPKPIVVIVGGAAKEGNIDWDKLEQLVYDPDEAAASALSPRRYREMVSAYERFKEKWRQ